MSFVVLLILYITFNRDQQDTRHNRDRLKHLHIKSTSEIILTDICITGIGHNHGVFCHVVSYTTTNNCSKILWFCKNVKNLLSILSIGAAATERFRKRGRSRDYSGYAFDQGRDSSRRKHIYL